MKIRVAIVEDDNQLRTSLAGFVNGAPDLCCVASCDDAEHAIQELPPAKPDVVLMDIRLPGLSGIQCVRRIKSSLARAQIMMLTVIEDYDRIYESLKAGATGYLLKENITAKLLDSIRELHAGGSPMSPSIARKLVLALSGNSSDANKLTEREMQILDGFRRGRIYKEIGDDLGISYDTVRTHVQHIYKKLHVSSRAEALKQMEAQADEPGM